MTVAKTKDYKKAKIVVLNDDWQTFIYVIYYKGEFYANNIAVTKQGEYTNTEYMQALEAVLDVAHRVVDKIIEERSPKSLLNKICQKLGIKLSINQLIEKLIKRVKE